MNPFGAGKASGNHGLQATTNLLATRLHRMSSHDQFLPGASNFLRPWIMHPVVQRIQQGIRLDRYIMPPGLKTKCLITVARTAHQQGACCRYLEKLAYRYSK